MARVCRSLAIAQASLPLLGKEATLSDFEQWLECKFNKKEQVRQEIVEDLADDSMPEDEDGDDDDTGKKALEGVAAQTAGEGSCSAGSALLRLLWQ